MGEDMTQGTACYFSTAICESNGKVRDINTGAVWDSVEAWQKDRHERAATLTYSFPCSQERLAASVHETGRKRRGNR